ncbi:hypothetical protein M9H77_07673 [Catharanthus roseus]|uniref:Uncharacterized protein n=1 Tax=Catharanthus roseus TaxID=4058 RepID=A0ACC0BW03_CATRO|nr:hypothetical protein M9H77_07673 [Catharanthus roseus]
MTKIYECIFPGEGTSLAVEAVESADRPSTDFVFSHVEDNVVLSVGGRGSLVAIYKSMKRGEFNLLKLGIGINEDLLKKSQNEGTFGAENEESREERIVGTLLSGSG